MPGYSSSMRAVWLDVPEAFLAERHRLGNDKLDELWEGVLHMVPPSSLGNARITTDFVVALTPIAARRGLQVWTDGTGLFDAPKNYRIADTTLARPDQTSARGLESAELVIEVLSPHDESRDKFPFYAKRGVREIWLVEPSTREVEVYALVKKSYRRVPATARGWRSPVLGITLSIVRGPKLKLVDGAYTAEV